MQLKSLRSFTFKRTCCNLAFSTSCNSVPNTSIQVFVNINRYSSHLMQFYWKFKELTFIKTKLYIYVFTVDLKEAKVMLQWRVNTSNIMSFKFARSCNSYYNHIALLQEKSLCWLTFKEIYCGPFKCKRVRWLTFKRKCWGLLNLPWDAADLSNAEKQKDKSHALNVFVEEVKWR
jgi:hypothetical protein